MTVEITARLETLSPSRAGDFKTCPRLYAFRTVERIPEPTTVHQARGTTAHLALQRLFDLPAPERTPRRLSELFRQAWTELRGLEEYEELFPTVEAERAWGLESMGLLLNYFLLEDPARLAPLGREEELKEDLGGIVIHGILDRIDRGEDGRLVITDYKTGKAPPERYAFGAFFALKIYALLVRRLHQETPAEIRLLYLNGPTLYRQPIDDRQLDGVERQLHALWERIEDALATDRFPARPGRLCNWCNFREICPAFA
jgi:putative RecB family exonuclease